MPARLVIATGHELSLALVRDGQVIGEVHDSLARGHAEALMPAVERLLAPMGGRISAIGDIVVEIGPGSFTGLRIGISAARALGLAWGVRVRGVRSTLLATGGFVGAADDDVALVALGAPRGQLWLEPVRLRDFRSLAPPVAVDREAAARIAGGHALSIGTADPGGARRHVAVPVAARAMSRLGEDILEVPEPLYVRPVEQEAAQ